MNEQQLLEQLSDVESAAADAKERMARAKKTWVDAETDLIGALISRDSLREQLRMLRNHTPNYTPDAREREINEFRDRYPELCDPPEEE